MQVNSPLGFDIGLIENIRVNTPAVHARVAGLASRRSFKKESQSAALMRAVQCMDFTTLSGDDTPGRIQRLCAKAKQPIQHTILEKLEIENGNLTVGAVCVYPEFVDVAVKALEETRIPVAAVSTSFPAGNMDAQKQKIAQIHRALDFGAQEIDVVISRELALKDEWELLYGEVVGYRSACGENAHLKVILEISDLETLQRIAKASAVAIMAGADFIKTSTGFGKYGATLEAGLVMIRQIRRFYDSEEIFVGLKPAGGIKKAKQALQWLVMLLEELDERWTHPSLFRIGASGLLIDLERQLYHRAFDRYPATHHLPKG